jgi:ATP-dependent DNA helicase RecQ
MVATLEGRDVLVALPTGFGKSLVYQVPALILERPTIVISPLIALMADQEQALRRRGLPVVMLHSRLALAGGAPPARSSKPVGTSWSSPRPRHLSHRPPRPSSRRPQPALLCVDEAHCISE